MVKRKKVERNLYSECDSALSTLKLFRETSPEGGIWNEGNLNSLERELNELVKTSYDDDVLDKAVRKLVESLKEDILGILQDELKLDKKVLEVNRIIGIIGQELKKIKENRKKSKLVSMILYNVDLRLLESEIKELKGYVVKGINLTEQQQALAQHVRKLARMLMKE